MTASPYGLPGCTAVVHMPSVNGRTASALSSMEVMPMRQRVGNCPGKSSMDARMCVIAGRTSDACEGVGRPGEAQLQRDAALECSACDAIDPGVNCAQRSLR